MGCVWCVEVGLLFFHGVVATETRWDSASEFGNNVTHMCIIRRTDSHTSQITVGKRTYRAESSTRDFETLFSLPHTLVSF